MLDDKKQENIEQALRFNEGKLDWTLLDYKSLEPVIKVLMEGAKKYAPENWKKGMKLRDIRKSLGRHVTPILNGDDIDPEWNLPHAAHAICNLMFYLYYTETEEGKQRVINEDFICVPPAETIISLDGEKALVALNTPPGTYTIKAQVINGRDKIEV